MKLLLIRHGETASNVVGALDTAPPGAPLTTLGEMQARALVGALEAFDIRAVYASPLMRAQMTARYLAEHVGVKPVVMEGLAEISAGALETRTDDAANLLYVQRLIEWIQGDLTGRIPEGPDGAEFLSHFGHAVDSIAERHLPDETVAVITHGGAMRVFLGAVAGLGLEQTHTMWVENTGMAVVERSTDGTWVVVEWLVEPVGGIHLRNARGEQVPIVSVRA